MKNARAWVALPAIAVLLIAQTTVARAATGDTSQTTGGGWFEPVVVLPPPPPPPPPPTSDPPPEEAAVFPTASTANTKANFGFVASATDKGNGDWDYQGELSYHDHGVALRLHSVDVEKVSVVGADAWFGGLAEVTVANGPSTLEHFEVHVHDGGEPGSSDTFEISLTLTLPSETAPYHRKGTLGGGNIQTRP